MAAPEGRRPTLDDIAERVGVSKTTVSKVLNRRAGYSQATRTAVEAAMRELHYVPITRDRTPHESGAIVVLFDTLVSLYSLQVLLGMTERAQEAGVDLITQVLGVGGAEGGPAELDEQRIRQLSDRGHAGVVLVTSVLSEETVARFSRSGLALLAVDAQSAASDGVVSIGSNHWAGGMQAARHLVDLGHTQIGFVGGSLTNLGIRERFAGVREVLETAGVPLRPELTSQRGLGTAYEATREMLARTERPTAIIASTDGDALLVARAAAEAGLRIPDDLSVVGYDDTYSALVPSPRITTVRAPLQEIGRLAVSTLLDLSAGRAPLSPRLQLATELVVRESTAPPRP